MIDVNTIKVGDMLRIIDHMPQAEHGHAARLGFHIGECYPVVRIEYSFRGKPHIYFRSPRSGGRYYYYPEHLEYSFSYDVSEWNID